MRYILYLSLVTLLYSCSSNSEEEEVKDHIVVKEAESEWEYPTGKRQLILDSWKLQHVRATNEVDSVVQSHLDSLNNSSITINIRDKNKTVVAGKPFIQMWGVYESDTAYSSIKFIFPTDSIEAKMDVALLSKDTLKLSGTVDSLNASLIWTFSSMGNKF